MQRIILFISLLILNNYLNYCYGQPDKEGIQFEQSLSWQQILAKAKKENKYIFVDCYATWCVPCKKMDEEVYSQKALGEWINQEFISVKVQMDTGKNDAESIKTWYPDAHQLMIENQVYSFPSFLFFSPDGKLVHKESGYHPPSAFLRTALNAADKSQQEYYLLSLYEHGKLPDHKLPDLIEMLSIAGDKKNEYEVSRDYVNNYLLILPDVLLFKPGNIYFIGSYLKDTNDPAFTWFYNHQNQIDQVTEKGYADQQIVGIIVKSEINPKLWSDASKEHPIVTNPNWSSLHEEIEKNFNRKLADESLIGPKIDWYKQHKEWDQLIGVETEKIEKYALDSSGSVKKDWVLPLNNILYDYFFEHGTNQQSMKKAVEWAKLMTETVNNEPDYLDTYANLLYKSGKKKEGIEQEEKALELKERSIEAKKNILDKNKLGEQEINKRLDFDFKELNVFRETVQKMKDGKPTWQTTSD